MQRTHPRKLPEENSETNAAKKRSENSEFSFTKGTQGDQVQALDTVRNFRQLKHPQTRACHSPSQPNVPAVEWEIGRHGPFP